MGYDIDEMIKGMLEGLVDLCKRLEASGCVKFDGQPELEAEWRGLMEELSQPLTPCVPEAETE